MQSLPFPRYFVPPRYKYSPQHHVLKHLQLLFLPQCQRPSAVQVILTLTIRWAMRYDSIMENKNMYALHPQVYPACYHFSNSNITVVCKDIRSCTTHIIGHANRILNHSPRHFLILTFTIQPCCELSAYWQQLSCMDNVRYWGRWYFSSFAPPTSLSTHFCSSMATT